MESLLSPNRKLVSKLPIVVHSSSLSLVSNQAAIATNNNNTNITNSSTLASSPIEAYVDPTTSKPNIMSPAGIVYTMKWCIFDLIY